MSVPYLTESRIRIMRRLRDDECERLEFSGPLALGHRERRFILGPWRRSREWLVVRPATATTSEEIVMITSSAELRRRGVEP